MTSAARAAMLDQLQNLPVAMRERPQWLLWRSEEVPGRDGLQKVPYYVNGAKRKGDLGGPEDLARLATFDAAVQRLAGALHFTGLGFAFLGAADGLIAIDLDGTVDADTGELRQQHREIIEACASYTERSPSGTGMHIIVSGDYERVKHDSFKHDSVGIEVYCGGRYFTCTGDHLPGTPAQVQPIKPYALAYLQQLVQQAKDAAKAVRRPAASSSAAPTVASSAPPSPGQQGNDFRRVNDAALADLRAWVPQALPGAHEWGGGYRVTSKALGRDLQEDLQLLPAGIMDFGEEQGMSAIDVVCKWVPGMQAPKAALHWLADRLGIAVLPATPLRQVRPVAPVPDADSEPPAWTNVPAEGSAQRPAAEGLPLLTLAQLMEKVGALTWLVKGVVPQASVGVMFGASGAFKSFIALDMALHVAHGLRWMGRRGTGNKVPVIFIAAEGGAGLWRRIDAWHREHGLLWHDAPVYVLPVAVDLLKDCSRVIEAAAALGVVPGLVVIDTLSQTFSGEENSATEVAAYLRELGLWFRESWQCSVLVIHHSGHTATERPRGSSAIRANVDFMLGVHRDEKEMLATLSCIKQKDGELFKDEIFALSVFDLHVDDDGDPVTALVARSVLSDDEKKLLVQHEASRGRSGRNALILDLATLGMRRDELRHLFYEQCGVADPQARRQAFYRALGWAEKAGLMEIKDGYVLLSKAATRDKAA